jgi:hypothetical protein
MNLSQLEAQVKYVSNAQGETTEVIVPVALWQKLMDRLSPTSSGLDPITRTNPKIRSWPTCRNPSEQW